MPDRAMNARHSPGAVRRLAHGGGQSKPAPAAESGTVLAFDFGEKRIGVAVGDTTVAIAHPLTTIHETATDRRFAHIERLINEWQPGQLVVGLPAHLDGTEHEMSRLARKFAQRLAGRFALPVTLVDERLTSVAADSALAEHGVDASRRKLLVDAAAACEILQTHFNSSRAVAPDKARS
jgi:putative holliday junction resolvase